MKYILIPFKYYALLLMRLSHPSSSIKCIAFPLLPFNFRGLPLKVVQLVSKCMQSRVTFSTIFANKLQYVKLSKSEGSMALHCPHLMCPYMLIQVHVTLASCAMAHISISEPFYGSPMEVHCLWNMDLMTTYHHHLHPFVPTSSTSVVSLF